MEGTARLDYDSRHTLIGLAARHVAGPRQGAFYEYGNSFGRVASGLGASVYGFQGCQRARSNLSEAGSKGHHD